MRFYNEIVAAWGDIFSLPLTVLGLVLGAVVTGLLWYFWPSWWEALRRFSPRRAGSRKRRRDVELRDVTDEEIDEVLNSEEELPAVKPAVFVALADRLAAQGRFAEAIRERLRAMVRELVERDVITHRPGWTVTELARAAGAAKAKVAPPIEDASNLFSDVWYAKQPAGAAQDDRMRVLAGQLHDAMAGGRR